jgi:hypothetical protein
MPIVLLFSYAAPMKKTLGETVALAAAEKKRLAAKGKKLMERVRALRDEREKMAHEMGKALALLKDKAMIHALGYQSFQALCSIGLGMSHDTADQLIDISQSFTVAQTAALGTAKATALIGLSRALGGKHTPSGLLSHRNLDVGRGKQFDVKAASADAIHRVASDLRDRAPIAARRGIHVTPEDKAFVARLNKALHAHGLDAEAIAIAGPHETGGKLRLDGLIRDARLLAKALQDAAGGAHR